MVVAAEVTTLVLTHWLSSRHSWRELRDEARSVFPGGVTSPGSRYTGLCLPGEGCGSARTGIMAPRRQRMPRLFAAAGPLLPRPRSSGDRALASGARCRRFESCRGHCQDLRRMLM